LEHSMKFTTRPTLEGTFGMVSSTHWIASQTAMRALERGGNAFDAAVTAAFVLHVVEPHLNGPGGEAPAIIATASDPAPQVLAGQGPAPSGATIDHFTSLGLDLIPGAGPIAATVPGAVDAWLLLLLDHGTQSLAEVLAPAIDYAAGGHPILKNACDTIAAVQELFETDWLTSAAVWLPEGNAPQPHDRLVNPSYARTLERLVREAESAGANREVQIEAARRAWREGFVAEAIDEFSAKAFRDSSGRHHSGLVTGADMAAFAASWEEPTVLNWNGFSISKTPPWGQGPVLLQTLAILDAVGGEEALDPAATTGIHVITEALKLAFADREAWYGDGADVPLETLLSPDYAARRAQLIGESASRELRPGSPDGRVPRIAAYASEDAGPSQCVRDASIGEPTVAADGRTRGDTCHIDIVDRWGNMISATPSGGWLQGSPVIPELGFALGTRLQMFWLEPDLASSLAPGRRPRTTLTPTLVHREERPVLACGSPGGDQQDQWQLIFLLRRLVGRQELQEAIDAPMWNTPSFPSSFYPRHMEPGVLVVEERLGPSVIEGLRTRGHEVRVSGPWSLGRMCAVAQDSVSGLLTAGANPRGMQGYACGR
jgi:gamma-glutamyltranspeptidase/glutathione hydrolase